MRLRVLLAAVLVGGLVLLPAAPASAISKETVDCILEQAEKFEATRDAEEVDTCEESPNPILPATNEIIWGAVAFLVVFFLLGRFALPAIQKGLTAREDRIRADLEAAEAAKQEAEGLLEEYRAQLADARNEAARIIEEARQAADAMRREVQEGAEAEAAGARERAQGEIDHTVSQARSELQRQVADFAVQLAERIVERNLDRDAQMALVDQYIAEVGGMSGNGGNGGDASGN